MQKIVCRQVNQADITAVTSLLIRSFPECSQQFWLTLFAELTRRAPPAGLPQYGYLLADGDLIVGALLLICTAMRRAEPVRCNLSSWCIAPGFAPYAALLVSQALRHRGVTYVNISPAPHTRAIIEIQGFSPYSGGVFVAMPALNRPTKNRSKILPARQVPIGLFDATDNRILQEHTAFGCMSFCCLSSGSAYPFVFRFRSVRGVPCAQLIYCRDVGDFVHFAGPIGRYLARHGRLFVLVDANGPITGLTGRFYKGAMPKYFKGVDPPRLGDLAYTETALFGI